MNLLPKYLYKFAGFTEYTADIFQNLRLYMALPTQFNDPFEGQLFPFGTSTAGASISLAAGKFNKDVAAQLNQYRVLSLGRNIRSKSMWAYYAANYSGFAIQFNTEHKFSRAQRVIYRSNNENIDIYPINGVNEIKKAVKYSLLYKSIDWQQEEEFRIIRSSARKYFHFGVQDIESIILGCNIKDNNKSFLEAFCLKHNIRLRHMWLVPRKSTIEFYTGQDRPHFDGTPYQGYIDCDL